jgi:thiaminase/transcriptional activator TenA
VTGSELLARHRQEWLAATQHPFLDGVGDGSLPQPAFRTWLIQDYLFVFDLLRFQSRLLSVAPRAGQRVVSGGLVALDSELGWFEGQAARLGLSLDASRHPFTETYRRTLLSYAEDWGAGITALWTGERTYLDSWTGVAPGAPAYREFVEHWTHPEFGVYVRELEQLANAAGPDEMAFLTICGLERQFWEMAWTSART